jgi:hypothetical protein
MTHDELRQLVPIFALDALPPEEESELVAHLKVCRECSVMLTEHQETAGMLALSADSVQAPPALRDRIMRQAQQTGQFEAPPAVVRQLPVNRFRRWQVAGLAAACVVALLAGSVVLQQLNRQTDRLNQQEIVVAQQRDALNIIGSPSSVQVPMTPTADGRGTEGKVFVSEEEDAAAVLVRGLDDPGDEVYTLWLIDEGNGPEPVEDFLPDDAVTVIKVDQPVDDEATLAITREPRRGNTAPEGPILLAASRA